VVERVGPSVTEFAVGDEVMAYDREDHVQWGTLAELVGVPIRGVALKPPALGWAEAGALPLAGLSAYQCVLAAGVCPGDTVLVHAASGGVGSFAVQFAAWAGARVIGTAGPANLDYVKGLGAEPVAYGDGLLDRVRALAPDGVDAALDLVGTQEALDTSLALVADRDRVVTIAAFAVATQLGIKLIGGGPDADPGTEIRPVGQREVLRLLDDGVIDIPVGRTYGLDEVADAHRASIGRHVRGKLVVVP
jgi:NADPH:quinone reductase-like Zn-dependent oxidoreductase